MLPQSRLRWYLGDLLVNDAGGGLVIRQGADMTQMVIALSELACLVVFVVVLIAGLLKLATQYRKW